MEDLHAAIAAKNMEPFMKRLLFRDILELYID